MSDYPTLPELLDPYGQRPVLRMIVSDNGMADRFLEAPRYGWTPGNPHANPPTKK